MHGDHLRDFLLLDAFVEHRKSKIIPSEIRWIFRIKWPIVALITRENRILNSAVQLGNFPTRKIASPDMWESFVERFRRGQQPLPQAWADLFGPLCAGTVDDLMIVGQVGQSLDGRVATATGHSKYINCPAGIEHLHRLRALVDVVVVGVGTALADNPQLTVRQVAGPQPARAVIDPKGRHRSKCKVVRRRWGSPAVDYDRWLRGSQLPPASRSSSCLRRREILLPPTLSHRWPVQGCAGFWLRAVPYRVALYCGAMSRSFACKRGARHVGCRGAAGSSCRRSSGPIRPTGCRSGCTRSTTTFCSTVTCPISGSSSALPKSRHDPRASLTRLRQPCLFVLPANFQYHGAAALRLRSPRQPIRPAVRSGSPGRPFRSPSRSCRGRPNIRAPQTWK